MRQTIGLVLIGTIMAIAGAMFARSNPRKTNRFFALLNGWFRRMRVERWMNQGRQLISRWT
ncbi:MAG: hypothetical protein IMX04_05150 [Candidatus Carbobacillus altaicus]|uniref:Uncharacterized protein n=1 Tax=Candidatus Carbonibacillus altaicus TaxID=2163959 RepID=A0A2R6XZB6_9BACL|nr:hypothetical protein [Candidatus Carbobacillus altaicus]PTQ55730.1 MAG: hypothetical protein BSOLF_1525 [Candidatus Carbobacillus altaicus]